MSFLFLCNHAGESAASVANAAGGSTATGYSLLNMIAGPRSTLHRGAAASGGVGASYLFNSNVDLNYVVIARADYLLTLNTSRVRLRERNASNVWSYVSGIDYNPLSSTSLVGVKAQDLVFSFTQTEKRGIEIYSNPVSGTDAQQFSKFYACNSFEFTGYAPELGMQSEELPIGSYATAINGDIPYEIESRFTITFHQVTGSLVDTFKALPQLKNWPFFLYDTAGDIWSHKLEHVILEGWTETINMKNSHTLELNFARLRQYE